MPKYKRKNNVMRGRALQNYWQDRKQPKTQSENQELQSAQSLASISDLLQPNQDQSSLVIEKELVQTVPNGEPLLPRMYSKRNGDVSQRLGKIHENEDTSNTLGNKGPKVFCSKRNGSISQRLRKIHEDETKIVVANVYDYFEQEYAELKKRCRCMDPTPLLTLSERTALATGVSETAVLKILLERARRNTAVSQKAARKRPRQPERIELQQPSQGDSVPTVEDDGESSSAAFVQEDSVPSVEDDGESSSAAFVTETLVIKEEPSDEDNDEPEIYVEMPNVKMESSGAYMDLADPIAINLKPETWNDATEQASASSETQAVHRTIRCYKEKTTQQHTGAPPASILRQLLQRHAGHLRVRSTYIDEDGLS